MYRWSGKQLGTGSKRLVYQAQYKYTGFNADIPTKKSGSQSIYSYIGSNTNGMLDIRYFVNVHLIVVNLYGTCLLEYENFLNRTAVSIVLNLVTYEFIISDNTYHTFVE